MTEPNTGQPGETAGEVEPTPAPDPTPDGPVQPDEGPIVPAHGSEEEAGDPVDDGWGDARVKDGFTPRKGARVDGGWKPDEHPHGEPDPGPSLTEDPGARGPEARSALPKNDPVPPEIERDAGDQGDATPVDDETAPVGSEK